MYMIFLVVISFISLFRISVSFGSAISFHVYDIIDLLIGHWTQPATYLITKMDYISSTQDLLYQQLFLWFSKLV